MFRIRLVLFITIVILFASYSVSAKVNRIYLPSPFSYHLIKEITEQRLYDLIQDIGQRGYRVQFLNETEYSNIVHALEMRTGEFLRRGNELVSYIAENSSIFHFDSSLNAFLEDNNITDTDIWMYLRDIEGSVEDSATIRSMSLGIRTKDDRTFDFDFAIESNVQFLNFPPTLSYQIRDDLLGSLENLLREQRVSPHYTLTLYLKDFSPVRSFISDYRNITRVNIGVIIDYRGRYIRELDWIVEKSRPQLVYTSNAIVTSIIASFHESAHELVRKVLMDDMSEGVSLSMLHSILLIDGMWRAYGGVANAEYTFSRSFSKPLQIKKMAFFLAGEVAEEIIIRDNFYYDYTRIQDDRNNALAIAYIGTCLGLGLWRRDIIEEYCPRNMFYLSFQQWEEWKDDLPRVHRQSLNRIADRWIEEARALAREVLIENFGILEDMTNLILRESTLDTQDLEMFYEGLSQLPVPVPLRVEKSQPQEALPLFDNTFQRNVFNRSLSLLPSSDFLSSQDYFGNMDFHVQDIESGTRNVLRLLRMVEVEENMRPYIRSREAPMYYEVPRAYAYGISSLYVKECIQVIKDFYSHL